MTCRQYGVGGVLVVSRRYIGGEPVMCRQCGVGGSLVVSRRYIGGESVMYRQCGVGCASVVCRRWRLAFSKLTNTLEVQAKTALSVNYYICCGKLLTKI